MNFGRWFLKPSFDIPNNIPNQIYSKLNDYQKKIDEALSGSILDVSYSGETTHYKVQCSTKEQPLTVSIQNNIGQNTYSVGDTVYLQIDKDNINAFRV